MCGEKGMDFGGYAEKALRYQRSAYDGTREWAYLSSRVAPQEYILLSLQEIVGTGVFLYRKRAKCYMFV